MRPVSEPAVRVTVFGGLRIWRGVHEVDPGPPRQQTVLALLLASAGTAVALARCVDAVWPTDPPSSAVNQIHRLIGQIRRTFEPTLSPHASGHVVVAAGAGYRMAIDELDVDFLRFRDLAAKADRQVNEGGAEKGLRMYAAALEIGQGPVFAGLDSRTLARPEIRALEREHESVVVAAATVALQHGIFPPRVVDAVRRAVAEAPLNEPLIDVLLRLLAATGRRAEALTVYETTRVALADELGVRPSPELLTTFAELLAEPDVGPTSTATAPQGGGERVRPAQLPRPPSGFVDRTGASAVAPLSDVDDSGTVLVAAISGMAGIGKTALAIRWAHQLTDQYPDGQLYVNLRGFDPEARSVEPATALAQFVQGLGDPPPGDADSDVDVRSARYRTLLADRRMIIVLDNARDSAQVRPLLPGSPGCVVLVTSRNRLTGLVAHDGARSIVLDRLSSTDARELLRRRIGPTRADTSPAELNGLIRACHGLPLALAIVAGRIASDPLRDLADYADELAERSGRLDALSTGEPGDDVRTVLSWSYRALSPDAARLLRHVGAHPGPDMSLGALASQTGWTPTRTAQLAQELVAGSLLSQFGGRAADERRYIVHDLVGAYAEEMIEQSGERGKAEARLVEHYVHATLAASSPYGRPAPAVLPAAEVGIALEDFDSINESEACTPPSGRR